MASPTAVDSQHRVTVNITKYLDDQAANVAAASIAPAAASGVGGAAVLGAPPAMFNNINITTVAAFRNNHEDAPVVAPNENKHTRTKDLHAVITTTRTAAEKSITVAKKPVISPFVPPATTHQRTSMQLPATKPHYSHQSSSVAEVADENDDNDENGDEDDGADTDSGEGLLYRDNVDLDSIEFYLPTAFTSRRHLEAIIVPSKNHETWRVVPKDRMKTVSVALILCLNVGVDPPDVDKPQSCARVECWIDPFGTDPYGMEEGVYRPIDRIGNELEKQYKRWQQRARYKQCLDPTTDDVKKLVVTLRKNAKDERVLFHYNGHGVPKPTQNGEIWVFNKQYTQYIPLSIYDLASWVGVPAVYVFDCHNAGVISEAFLAFVNSCDAAEQQQQSVAGVENVNSSQYAAGLAAAGLQTPTRAGAAAAAAAAEAAARAEPGVAAAVAYNNELLGVQGASTAAGDGAATAEAAARFQHGGSPPLGEAAAPKPATWRELREVTVFLCACSRGQELPMNAELPADVFTACLTTPIKMALQFFWLHNRDRHKNITLEMLDRIPGQMQDRRTMLGELNWIFTAITDTIAWNMLPRELFQKLFRQDLLLASLLRNFLLAQRIMQRYGCFPVSHPRLPNSTVEHSMWDAWDLVLDECLFQFVHVVDLSPATVVIISAEQPPQQVAGSAPNAVPGANPAAAPAAMLKPFQNSSFFSDQLTAFQVWLTCGGQNHTNVAARRRPPPEQLPVILQVLLSHSHRLRALDLLGRFCDLGPWAVNQALSVGIFPYILKLLQATARELRPYLVFIWAKIMAVDSTVQPDMTRDNAHRFFMLALTDQSMPNTHRTMAAFCLAQLLNSSAQKADEVLIKSQALKDNVVATCLEMLSTEISASSFRQWLALALGHLWHNYAEARWQGTRDSAHEELFVLLNDPDAEVRAACIYALRTFLAANNVRLQRDSAARRAATPENSSIASSGNITDDHADAIDTAILMKLLLTNVLVDGNVLVRKEFIIALHWFVVLYEKEVMSVAVQFAEDEKYRESLREQREHQFGVLQHQQQPSRTTVHDVVTVSTTRQHKSSAPAGAAQLIYPPDYSMLPNANLNAAHLHKFSMNNQRGGGERNFFPEQNFADRSSPDAAVETPTTSATGFAASFLPFLRSGQNRAKSPLQNSTSIQPAATGRRSAQPPPPPPPPPPMPSHISSTMPRNSSSSQLLAVQQQTAGLGSPASSTTSLTKSTANALNVTLRKMLAQQQHSQTPTNLITYPPYSSMLTYGNIYQNVWRTLLYCAYDPYPELATMAADIANYIQSQIVITPTPSSTPTISRAPTSNLATLFSGGNGSEENLLDFDTKRQNRRQQQQQQKAGGDQNDAAQQQKEKKSPGRSAASMLNRSVSLQQPQRPIGGAGGGGAAATVEEENYADESSTTPIANNQTPLRAPNKPKTTEAVANEQFKTPDSTRYQRSRKLNDPGPSTAAKSDAVEYQNFSSDEGETRASRFLVSPVPAGPLRRERLDQHLDSAFADWCATYYANPLTGVEAQDDPLSVEYVRKKMRTQRNREIRSDFRESQQQNTGNIRYQNQIFVQKNQPQAGSTGAVPLVTLFEDYRPYLLVADADCVSVWNWQDGVLANSFLNGHMRGHRIRDLKLINNHDTPLLAVASDDGSIRIWKRYEESFSPSMQSSYSSSIHRSAAAAGASANMYEKTTSASAEDLTKDPPAKNSSHTFGLLKRMASSASTSAAATGNLSSQNALSRYYQQRSRAEVQQSFTNSSPLSPHAEISDRAATQFDVADGRPSTANKYADENSNETNYYYWGSTEKPAHLVAAWNALPEIAFPPPSFAASGTSAGANVASAASAAQFGSLKYSGSGIVTAFEQKPRLLILSGDVRFIRIWDLKQERKVHDIPTNLDNFGSASGNSSACVSALASDPNRAALFVAGFGDGSLALYDRRCAAHSAQVQRYAGHQSWILSACIPCATSGSDDQRIYTASTNGEVRVWEMRMPSGECVHKIPVLPNTSAMHRHPNAGILACGSAAAAAPAAAATTTPGMSQRDAGNAVAFYSTMGEQMSVVKFYDGFGGQRIGPVSCLNFHPYRHLLAVGTGDHMVSIVSAEKADAYGGGRRNLNQQVPYE